MRRAPTRSRRGLILRGGIALLAVCLTIGGGWWLRTSSAFTVQKVESGAYRFTAQDELEGIFGSFLGRNIWTLSSADVTDSLSVLPWVRDLQVRRRLPGSIEVDFREWRPLLVIETETNGRGKAGGPLVVVEDGWPVGLYTQREALEAKDEARETPVEAVMSAGVLRVIDGGPVFALSPVERASRLAREKAKIAVADGGAGWV